MKIINQDEFKPEDKNRQESYLYFDGTPQTDGSANNLSSSKRVRSATHDLQGTDPDPDLDPQAKIVRKTLISTDQ